MNDKEVKVSDWSQKYKLVIYGVSVITFSAWVALKVDPFMDEVIELLKKIAGND